MNANQTSYRYSLRGLFRLTLGCSLLLFEWKMWGIASLLGTLATLVCGAAMVRYAATHPAKNGIRTTIVCVLISLTIFNLYLVFKFLSYHYDSYFDRIPFNGEGLAFLTLLSLTAITVWILRLMFRPQWSLLFPLLMIFNLWFGKILYGEIKNPYYLDSSQFGSDLLRGYTTAMSIFAIALILRWVKSLPTTRDDLTR